MKKHADSFISGLEFQAQPTKVGLEMEKCRCIFLSGQPRQYQAGPEGFARQERNPSLLDWEVCQGRLGAEGDQRGFGEQSPNE